MHAMQPMRDPRSRVGRLGFNPIQFLCWLFVEAQLNLNRLSLHLAVGNKKWFYVSFDFTSQSITERILLRLCIQAHCNAFVSPTPRGISDLNGSLQPSKPTTVGLLAHQASTHQAITSNILLPNVLFLLWMILMTKQHHVLAAQHFRLLLFSHSCVKNKLFAHPVLKYEINTHLTIGALALWQDSRCWVGRAGFNPRLGYS
jgi:hypothetical protein